MSAFMPNNFQQAYTNLISTSLNFPSHLLFSTLNLQVRILGLMPCTKFNQSPNTFTDLPGIYMLSPI